MPIEVMSYPDNKTSRYVLFVPSLRPELWGHVIADVSCNGRGYLLYHVLCHIVQVIFFIVRSWGSVSILLDK